MTKDINSIQKAKEMVNNPHLKGGLAFISFNYSFHVLHVWKNKTWCYLSISVIKTVKEKLKNLQRDKGKAIYKKINKRTVKNEGFKIISNVLEGIVNSMENLEDYWRSTTLYYKFALIASVDVERLFLRYKSLLANNRRSFTFENIQKILDTQCNSFG